jgi:hypothetical protein
VSLVPFLALLPAAAFALESSPAPGFGIILGAGTAEFDAPVRKAGFTSRRLQDGGRSGALTLMAEEYTDGVRFARLDPTVRKEDVHLDYQALYLELKRYFPLFGPVTYFWGLRGGATRITGRTDRPSGEKNQKFQQDQVAPLWFLALPLALENPGFLLLGLVEGGSAGAAVDLVPNRIWLELQVSAAVVPRHRDAFIAIETPFVITRTLSLSMAF